MESKSNMSISDSKDLVSFAFRGPEPHTQQSPIYINAKQPSQALSAAPFRRLVRSLIAGFKAHHVQVGDCVLVQLDNFVLHSAVFFAIVGAGGVYMGCSPTSPRHELDHFISLSHPRLILTTTKGLPTVRDVCGSRGFAPSQIFLVDESSIDHLITFAQGDHLSTPFPNNSNNNYESPCRLEHLIQHGESDWMRIPDEATAKVTPAAMFTTSGTSGLPKAAIRTHHTIISHHLTVHYEAPFPVRRLMALPMSHSFGDFWTNLFPIRYGHPLYVLPRFDLGEFLAAVHHHQITETYLVPTAIHMINQTALPVRESLASLRYIGVSGAPIDGASLQRCQALLHPEACVAQLWGMTEVGVVFQNRYTDTEYPGSIGRLLPNYEIRLVRTDDGGVILHHPPTDNDDHKLINHHPDEKETGPSPPGELYVRGPGLLAGYKGRTDSVVDEEGWFRTGDMAYAQDAHYYIIGRAKELIKVRGYSVAPAEIEALLLQAEPRLLDVAVLGVSLTDGSSEVPRAYVVVDPDARTSQGKRITEGTEGNGGKHGKSVSAEEICALVRQHLASYKALDGGVIFVDSIPRTGIGKLHRSKLARLDRQRETLAALLSES